MKPYDIQYIVIHASATNADHDIGAAIIREWHTAPRYIKSIQKFRYLGHYYDAVSALPIEVRHKRGRGWSDIGYHSVIKRDGTLESGRSLVRAGAHVKGFNAISWGICLAGGVDHQQRPDNNFTARQFVTLDQVVSGCLQRAPNAEVVGHRDLSPDLNHNGIIEKTEWLKDCPCFDVKQWWAQQ